MILQLIKTAAQFAFTLKIETKALQQRKPIKKKSYLTTSIKFEI
jgi:hypothetical protein